MPGILSSISNGEEIIFAENADFSGNTEPSKVNGLQTNGQLWIGSTIVNVGNTNINVGTLTSPLGTLSIGYSSPNITLDLTGGSVAVQHLTADSGGQLNPVSNNFNIFGLSGSKTSGLGATITVKSPPFSQVGSTATSSLNSGEFVTAAVTRTLPASAGLADGDLVMFVVTSAAALVIQSVGAQKIRLGNVISAAAGTATSTQIGDSITLRFNATDGFWYAVSAIGSWTI